MGGRIRAIRMKWGWSQEEVAQVLKVDQATISFWERGRILPSGAALVALAGLFRISVEALQDGLGFNLPEAPSDPSGPRAGRNYPRSISLPVDGESQVMVVDKGNGSYMAGDLAAALVSLTQGLKGNRRVWVVLE